MDKLSPERRSSNMSKIRSRDTVPEITVRTIVRGLGYSGYRLNRKDIPGKPDIAWIGRKIAIFVHGCFWHGHNCKEGRRKPKSNTGYWLPKIENNKIRDAKNARKLRSNGWRVITVWECELRNAARVEEKLREFLAKCHEK